MDLTERIEWNGRSIAAGRAGSGPDVVFCHGTPFSSRVWSRYADALTDRFTVHLWDMPGYGASSKRPEHPLDFGVQAAALTAVLAHWDLKAAHVVAHDFGGAVSLQAALNHGATYASLMLVDVVAIPPSGSPFFRFVGQHPDVLAELPAYIHEAVVRAYIPGAAHKPLPDHDLDELVAPWLGADGQPAFYRQIAQYDESFLIDNEAKLGTLDLPVRVLWGEQDAWLPIEVGRRLADLIPGASFEAVPDAGHLVQYDTPVALTAAITTWLTGQRA